MSIIKYLQQRESTIRIKRLNTKIIQNDDVHLEPVQEEPHVGMKKGVLVFSGSAQGDIEESDPLSQSGKIEERGFQGPSMRILLDTSVLVAALVEAHPRHVIALIWLKEAKAGKRK